MRVASGTRPPGTVTRSMTRLGIGWATARATAAPTPCLATRAPTTAPTIAPSSPTSHSTGSPARCPRAASASPHRPEPKAGRLRRGSTPSTSSTPSSSARRNRFAHAAAVAVAEAPGQGVQPAVHLRRVRPRQDPPAARHRALRPQPLHRRAGPLRELARSSPTSSSTRSVTTRPQAFQRRYRDVDVLLIDDIQFLRGQGSRPRRSSSTRSTPCTTPTSRSSSPPTVPPKQLAGARGPAAQPLRVGADHRRAAARPRDAHRDPAQEGGARAADAPPDVLEFIASKISDQHPRARGCADPGHRLRQPQPAAGGPGPGRDRAQGPDPRAARAPEITAALDHGADGRLLRPDDRRPVRLESQPGAGHRPADRHVPVPGADRAVACPRSASSSAAATTPR